MLKRIIKHPLTYILLFSAIIRLAMIKYGLPFWLYNDEPPFVLATLKMMQLKTVLPVLHEEAFKPFFYYPPYISYLFLPFFILVIGVKFIFFSGSLNDLQTVIASDPSILFLTARIITIVLSLITIYLVYKISLNLIKNKTSAYFSALIFATSLMHISLSITGKHWMPILLFSTIGLYVLTKENWSLNKRFYISAVIVGIGTGISTIVILFSFIMIFWYIFYEKKSILKMFIDPMMYKVALIIIALFFIPVALYPASLGFAPDMTLHDSKSIVGYITSPFIFPALFLKTEPILSALFLIGLIFSIKRNRNFYLTTILFIIAYSLVFYIFFRFEYRFLLPLLLPLTLGASYGIKEIVERLSIKNSRIILCIIVIILITFSVRISILGSRNDSRVIAKNWLEQNTKPEDKVIVYANLMRLPTTRSNIIEQEFIDPTSLRTNDKNEKEIKSELRNYRVFNALNLYNVKNENLYNNIVGYAKKNNYSYLVISKLDFLNNPEQLSKVKELTKNAQLVAKFGNNESSYSLSKTEIGPTLKPLFSITEFGPEIEIYKLLLN